MSSKNDLNIPLIEKKDLEDSISNEDDLNEKYSNKCCCYETFEDYEGFFSDKKFFFTLFGSIILSCAVLIPTFLIGSKDKDINCLKPLWVWICVFNIFWVILCFLACFSFYIHHEFPETMANNSLKITIVFITIFILIWAIIGLLWSTNFNAENNCKKLDAICRIISIFGCVVSLFIGVKTLRILFDF
ncbi:hypothetical protein M0811_07740 [Anaeramoeba ignava]|uniref:Uncharacterized protein n=1 Tax=Anaeramoeba ignava TaxID=1746090 RepID=A0A9Q0LKA3_ANAIG|nr:hypothetical protein M0811_07740 [Anaeramoeba ignava]